MAKWCFGVCFCSGFHVIVVCFWCVWHSSKIVKLLVFFVPVFRGFCGVAYSCLFGFGRFRCFSVPCVCYYFLSCFCFCFVFVLLLYCFGYWLLFLYFLFFVFVFLFFFLFFGGFKGQVRWPKGPPHLALNPPYFICFSFFVVFYPCLPFFVSVNRKTCFFPQKGHFGFLFECLPLFLFSLFWASSFFHFLFLCLSLVLFFLPSFLFLISVSGSCFLFLFCFFFSGCSFVFFVFLFVVLFCLESSYLICFCFAYLFLLLFFVFLALVFGYFWFLETHQKHLWKMELPKTAKMKNAEKKKRTFWQEQLAQLCSQIVSFFSLLCFSKFCIFCWKHYRNWASTKNKQQKTKQLTNFIS